MKPQQLTGQRFSSPTGKWPPGNWASWYPATRRLTTIKALGFLRWFITNAFGLAPVTLTPRENKNSRSDTPPRETHISAKAISPSGCCHFAFSLLCGNWQPYPVSLDRLLVARGISTCGLAHEVFKLNGPAPTRSSGETVDDMALAA